MLDVKRFANQLLNPDRPEVVRALDLYELHVSLFLFKKNDQNLARKYCAMFLLDYIEECDGVQKGDLVRVASLSDYCELFSELMREHGWIGLCKLGSRFGLDGKLQHGIQNAKSLADAIDLVCRSAQEGQRLSLECAERVSRSRFKVAEPSGHKVAKSPARTQEETVLVYLLLTHCADLLPPALKKDSFAENLLPQVRDIASLQRLFSAYNRVLALFLTVGQRLGRPLLLKGDEVETSILWKPLNVETKKLIDRYAGFHQLGVPSE
jgi:hypothetical protein